MSGRSFRKGCLIPLAVTVCLLWGSCSAFLNYDWKSALPKDLGVSWTLERHSEFAISPGGSCGGAIFKMKKTVQTEIQSQGIDYFQNASHPRRWRESDITWMTANGSGVDRKAYAAFQCVMESSRDKEEYKRKFSAALKSNHSYYGIMSGKAYNTRILVIPKERLVYVGYWD